MKRTVLIFFIATALFAADGLQAQRRGMHRGMHHGNGFMRQGGFCFGNHEYLRKTLKLSENQIESIGRINKDFGEKLMQFRVKLRPKRKALRMLLLKESIDFARVRALLREISDIEIDIRMIRIKHRISIEKVLTSKQRLMLRNERKRERKRKFKRND